MKPRGMRPQNGYLRQLERRREAAGRGTAPAEKPPEEMTPEERKAAIAAAEWEVRKAEIRHLEELRRAGATPSPEALASRRPSGPSSLSDVLREKKQAKRKHWR